MSRSARTALVGGGVRSGKSAFALRWAERRGSHRVFLATAQAWDDEMRLRIDAHRTEREDRFTTIEVPLALPESILALDADVAVVDCLTLWISNLLMTDADDAGVARAVDALEAAVRAAPCPLVLVTNEVGLGVVPDNALARRFRDLTGLCHQRLARSVDEVYLGAMGCILRLRPAPVLVMTGDDADS